MHPLLPQEQHHGRIPGGCVSMADAVGAHLKHCHADLLGGSVHELARVHRRVKPMNQFGPPEARHVWSIRIVRLVAGEVHSHDTPHAAPRAHPCRQLDCLIATLGAFAPHGAQQLVDGDAVLPRALCQAFLHRLHNSVLADGCVGVRAMREAHGIVPHFRVRHSGQRLKLDEGRGHFTDRRNVAADDVVHHVELVPCGAHRRQEGGHLRNARWDADTRQLDSSCAANPPKHRRVHGAIEVHVKLRTVRASARSRWDPPCNKANNKACEEGERLAADVPSHHPNGMITFQMDEVSTNIGQHREPNAHWAQA
mmetsp:Transcript_108499/g.305804  ORF Transcript_108499/g.305804 Transcript_108499/m.305804 type:complete len:310 (+) Transcript_108499:322-1251(+)